MKKINDNTVQRAKELLEQMSLDEKLYQLSSQMLYSVDENYEEKREHREGNFRNPGHFMHFDKSEPVTAKEVAARINRDVKLSMEVQPHGIPPIEHGEALHGAQWGMATCFPQPIAMAATFDDELVAEIGDVIGIGNAEALYYCFVPREISVAKARLATEELYRMGQLDRRGQTKRVHRTV